MWKSSFDAKSCHYNLQMRKFISNPVVQSQPWDLQPWRIHLCRKRLFSARCEEFKIFKTPKIEFIWLKVDMADSDSENWYGHTVWFAMMQSHHRRPSFLVAMLAFGVPAFIGCSLETWKAGAPNTGAPCHTDQTMQFVVLTTTLVLPYEQLKRHAEDCRGSLRPDIH